MNDEYTSRLLLPKKGTVVKPEIAKEETETGKKRQSAKLQVGRKILGFDVVGEVGKQKQSFRDQEASRKGASLNITKRFKDDRGGVSAEFFKTKDKDPLGSEKTKGFNVGLTYKLPFNKGGLTPKQSKEIDVAEPFGVINAKDFAKLRKASKGEFMTSRGGRAAIRGTKFKGVF